jgi:site-specific DNA-methyltransferase (adenine-specific)
MSIRLLHGDCLEIMKDISANSVDLIICDLPYGCLTSGKPLPEASHKKYGNSPNKSYSGCGWDIKIDLQKFWTEAKRILKNDHSPVIHFCTTKFGNELINSNPDWFRYDLVWDKQRGVSFLQANKMPMRSHEMIYVFSKKGAFYERKDITGNFQSWKVKREGTPSEKSIQYGTKRNNTEGGDGKRCVLSVIREMGGNRKTNGHPTEKPENLYRFLIERYCPVGGTVLDPTFGSGNSVMTAYAMGRHAIGIEKDDVFYKKCSDKIIPENVIS